MSNDKKKLAVVIIWGVRRRIYDLDITNWVHSPLTGTHGLGADEHAPGDVEALGAGYGQAVPVDRCDIEELKLLKSKNASHHGNAASKARWAQVNREE